MRQRIRFLYLPQLGSRVDEDVTSDAAATTTNCPRGRHRTTEPTLAISRRLSSRPTTTRSTPSPAASTLTLKHYQHCYEAPAFTFAISRTLSSLHTTTRSTRSPVTLSLVSCLQRGKSTVWKPLMMYAWRHGPHLRVSLASSPAPSGPGNLPSVQDTPAHRPWPLTVATPPSRYAGGTQPRATRATPNPAIREHQEIATPNV